MTRARLASVLTILCLATLRSAAAADSTQPAAAASGNQQQQQQPDAQLPGGEAERLNVENIKEKYWARGDESEIGVVQNRLYSKEHKLEFGLFGGFITSDPFLSTKSLGGSVGFHFSEYLSLHFIGWTEFVSPSSALQTFQDTIGATTNTNPANGYYGGEVDASILYGKLSLIGKAIIYYDLHLSGGLGVTTTDSGNNLTPSLGIGQRFFLTKTTSLRIDYRLMRYNETIVEKVITPKLGQPVGTRVNWTNSITLGVSFLFGVFK